MTHWDAIAILILSAIAGFETFRAVLAYLNDFPALAASQVGEPER